jgi:hypothetical protein
MTLIQTIWAIAAFRIVEMTIEYLLSSGRK